MRFWVAGLLFALTVAREKTIEITPLEGVLDERRTFVPLGYTQIFNCEAVPKTSHLIRSQPSWHVLFFDEDTGQMERANISSIRDETNERFRQLENSSLLLVGAQKWHHEAVLECVLESGSTSAVVSRHVIVIQDCSEEVNRNPCLYGQCEVKGFVDVFEVARCNCVLGFTGNFCTEYAERTVFNMLLFYAPIAFLLLVILVVFCIRKKVEFVGKQRPMRTERQIAKFNSLPATTLRYPSAFLSENTMEVSAKEVSKEEKTQEGSAKKSKKTASTSRTSQTTSKRRKSVRK